MNSHLRQIESAARNLADYIQSSGDRASAVLVRAQAQKILGHAQDFAREKAEAALSRQPLRSHMRSLRRKAHDPVTQFELNYQW